MMLRRHSIRGFAQSGKIRVSNLVESASGVYVGCGVHVLVDGLLGLPCGENGEK